MTLTSKPNCGFRHAAHAAKIAAVDSPAIEPIADVDGRGSSTDGLLALVPGLAAVVVGTVFAAFLSAAIAPLSTLVCAVLVGAVAGNVGIVVPAMDAGVDLAAKRVLRVGVVLLGLRLSIGDVFDLGAATIVIVVGTVTATFFGTQWLGRRLGLSRDLSLLIATGYSICGASAIAAVESSTDAEREEVAAAIGLVTLFGSLAIVVLPVMAVPLGLDDVAFGTWVGASVHDVAQVVATASTGGAAVVAVAIVVKLTRVVLLAPIVAGVAIRRRMIAGPDAATGERPPIVPLFVAAFLAMIALRSTGLLSPDVIAAGRELEGWLLAAALVALGSGVRIGRLRRLGLRPLVVGAMAWVLVAAVSLAGVGLVG
ncbi:MAG: putative sulfate exporter family transporter [Ilumatobacteraceae bacterium]